MLQYSPRIVTDNLVMCLDPSQNKSYPTTDLPVKGGLVMWMDAADDTTFSYSSGTTVSQWRDKSGFGYHMVPVSAGPTRNAFLNSRKVLAFTTSQDIQNLSIDLRTSPYTVFIVSRYTSPSAGTGRILTSNGGYNNWLLGHWASETNKYYANGWVYSTYVALDTNWKLYLGDWGGPSNDLANFYGAGTAITTNSADASAGPWTLGINANSGERSNCEAAEIIVFNRLLSTTERKQIHTYLGQKWGILNTDRSIIDLSGNDDNGLLGNGTTADMPLFDYYNKGALKLDGSTEYITVPNSTILSPSTVTVSLWIKRNSYQSGITNFLRRNDFDSYAMMATYNTDTVWFRIRNTVPAVVDAQTSMPLNTWTNLVGTFDGSNVRIYKDGALANTAANTSPINYTATNTTMIIGRDDAVSGRYAPVSYGSILIYSRALSAAEVAQNYEAQKSRFANTIVQQGLLLNLDAGNPYSYAGAGTTWYDVSGNNKIGTLTGGVTYSSIYGGDFILDGVNGYIQTDLNQNTDNAQITWEAWFWDNSAGFGANLNTAIISNYGPVATTPFTILHIFDNGIPFFGQRNSSGTADEVYGLTNICNGVWHHVVGVVDSSNMLIYVDGVLQQTKTKITGTTTSGQNLVIGGNHLGRYQSCRIASARCYNIALSAAQVLQNYNATKGRFGL